MGTHTAALVINAQRELDIESALATHRDGIVKYCYSLLLDYHEAQDAAQDVLLAAMQSATTLRDSSAIGSWLYRIAYNRCMNILKRRKLYNLFLRKEAAETDAGVYEDNYSFGISRELQAALSTLSHKDRALVYSRAVDEMDYSQLEEIYGTKAATLRKRYERARRKLEDILRKG